MEGGQSGTYLRQTRALSSPRVSVTKTYRDETKLKLIFWPDHKWPSSAVEFSLLYSTAEEGHCDLAKIFIFVSSLYVLATLAHRPDDALISLR